MRYLVKHATYRWTVGLLGFTARLVLIQKNPKGNIFITEQCFVCPNCKNRNKAVTFGCLIDMGIA